MEAEAKRGYKTGSKVTGKKNMRKKDITWHRKRK